MSGFDFPSYKTVAITGTVSTTGSTGGGGGVASSVSLSGTENYVQLTGSENYAQLTGTNNYVRVTGSDNFIYLGDIATARVHDKRVETGINLIYDVLTKREEREDEQNYITPIYIEDPSSGARANVTSGKSLVVSERLIPTDDLTPKIVQQRRLLLTRLKDENGSEDLNINGSVTPVNFSLLPAEDKVRWVNRVSLVFNSTDMDIATTQSRRFGPVAAPGLTNGLKFFALQKNVIVDLFIDNVVKIGDFYEYADPNSIINDKDSIANGVDFLMIVITFNVPITLFPGTTDFLRMTIQDDLSGIALFRVNAYCYEEDYTK